MPSRVEIPKTFATRADYRECRKLHRDYGTSFYYASRLFPRDVRRRVDAVYGFIRVADEWADDQVNFTISEREHKLKEYRSQLLLAMDGVKPTYPTLRALVDAIHEVNVDVTEPLIFLDSMEMDLRQNRYRTYEDLCKYMRGSAVAVGMMVCEMMGEPVTEGMREGSFAMGEAMQMTNFLRDIREDAEKGRLYLPQEDLEKFGVTEASIFSSRVTPAFAALMKFEIDRTRALYGEVDRLMPHLPSYSRKTARLGRVLYSKILDKIEEMEFDVFSARARTGRFEKLATMLRVALGRAS